MSAAAKQAQLRSLMKQQQAAAGASATAAQRVDSPLAKYTANGDLVCILCKAPVKSSVAWNAHCATPQHKQNLELLLQKKKQQKAAAASAPAPDQEEGAPTAKRAKLAESESQATHHNEASMPDISSAAPAPPMDEPEAPQVSNEEILRQLRSEWDEQEAAIIAPVDARGSKSEDEEKGEDLEGYDSEEEEEMDLMEEGEDEDMLRAKAQAARRLTILQSQHQQLFAPSEGEDDEDEDDEEASSSSSEEVDINSLYNWRARQV